MYVRVYSGDLCIYVWASASWGYLYIIYFFYSFCLVCVGLICVGHSYALLVKFISYLNNNPYVFMFDTVMHIFKEII